MGTVAQTNSLSYWVKPSRIADDAAELFSGNPGVNVAANTKDFVLGPVADGLQWVKHLFGCPTDPHVETLGTISSGLAIPNFFYNLGQLRTTYQLQPEGTGVSRDVVKKALLTVNAASESTQFFHTIDVLPLSKEALKSAKSVFWGALLGVDLMNIFDGIRNAENLEADLKSSRVPGDKEILQHRISHNFLSIAKSATTVAMASIALVSILFASLAQGILFSPIVFLSLSSAWIILNYTTYFYGKMIDRWDAGIPLRA